MMAPVWLAALWSVPQINQVPHIQTHSFFPWTIWTANKHYPHAPALPTQLANLSHGLSNPHHSGHLHTESVQFFLH